MADYPFLEYKNCVICGSSDSKVIYSWESEYYQHSKYETCSWDGRQKIPLSIVMCRKCNLVYTKPSFSQEYLSLVYPKDLIPKEENIGEKFKSNRKFTSLINIILKHKKRGVLLDVGTRYGVFPWLAEKYGFQTFGIEYNPQAVKRGKKYFKNIFHGSSRDIREIMEKNKLEKPDIIVLDDVLEHLVDPTVELEIFSEIQVKGDILVLRQMDYNSLGRKLYGRDWYYFQPAAHQFYFTKKSIERLLNKHNYRIEKTYKSSLVKNLPLTVYKNFCKRRRNLEGQLRPLYLTKRFASYNDMFTVIAVKD